MTLKVLFSCVLVLFAFTGVNSVAVICYYASWTAYQGIGPELFDPHLCTHLNYAFIGITSDGKLKANDNNLDINQGLLKRVTNLKVQNPKLKVLLSVGGASWESTQAFSSIATDPTKRGVFISSAIDFVLNYGFDGVDIDWEYPYWQDRDNFITLLKEVKAAFQPRGWLVTAAVAANPTGGYDVVQMSQYLDFINIMTYDYYGSWSSYTGQNSALYASSVESSWETANLNVVSSANNWINAGAPKSKLAIGTGSYGRSFTLRDPNQHGIHAPISGAGLDGGTATYSTICTSYGGWTRVWDDQQNNPYKYQGNQWIGYDDAESIGAKAEYAKNEGFYGAMIWTIDGDDVKGLCGETQPLLKALNRALQ